MLDISVGIKQYVIVALICVPQLIKNPSVIRETWVQSLSWEDPLEKGKAPVFWPGEFHGPYSLWVTKSRKWLSNFCFHFVTISVEWLTIPVVFHLNVFCEEVFAQIFCPFLFGCLLYREIFINESSSALSHMWFSNILSQSVTCVFSWVHFKEKILTQWTQIYIKFLN